jgi:catechol 2,3-dioxygenase-like lactoylglutathione lyase family enzyme
MLDAIHPKLPFRNKEVTKDYYINKLGFKELGDYPDYLIVAKDNIEIHFFRFEALDPKENYGQVYIRTKDIVRVYQTFLDNKVRIHPDGYLEMKPWGQREFALLDPDSNLLTFGQAQ